jgi:hypothetical protein
MCRRPARLPYGGTFDPELGHTQWVNEMMVQTGMTTTSRAGGEVFGMDF